MAAPVLFTARGGVVLFRMRPVPDWIAYAARRAINREGLRLPISDREFAVWEAAYEQLRDAVTQANNQRRLSAPDDQRSA